MIAYLLIAVGIALRIFSHVSGFAIFPPNFSPVGGMSLFAGAYLGGWKAWWIPCLALLVSDIFIGFYHWPVMVAVYGSFALIVLLGKFVGKKVNLVNVVAGSLLASVAFYLTTNFAVWALPQSFYPHTVGGLLSSYVAAIPFLKYTLMGDLFFSGAFFLSYELAKKAVYRWQPNQANLLLKS